jgi:NADP-dependent 3-hydroxy acid dehydrogenase YdfG
MEMETQGRQTVVITGASAGIGRAIALAFAREGARIGLIARGIEKLESTRREVEAAGGQALVLPVDVADAEQVDAAARAVEAAFGSIDVWVNNAMTSVFSPAMGMTAADYRRVTEVTYLGVVHGTLAALRSMQPRDAGMIIQVGSALAYRSIPLQSAYCGAKAAIRGFTDSLRSELLHDGSNVRITMLVLPAVNTPQFTWVRNRLPRQPRPLGGPIYAPEVIARAVLWVASREHPPRELTIGRPALLAVLGQKVAPGLVDRYLARVGYEGQQTGNAERPGRADNLYEPGPGDPGADGPFVDEATNRSPQLWIRTHATQLALGIAGAGAAAGGLAARRS